MSTITATRTAEGFTVQVDGIVVATKRGKRPLANSFIAVPAWSLRSAYGIAFVSSATREGAIKSYRRNEWHKTPGSENPIIVPII